MEKYENKISKNGMNVLNDHFNYNEIIYLKEILNHDGYDRLGPESELWTLYIITKKNGIYIFNKYYYEDWFRKNILPKYELEIKCDINYLLLDSYSINDFNELKKYKDKMDDTYLKEFFK